jgi:hypothetical protein
MSILGFTIAPPAGTDFTPILKYDAKAGRFFRIDRVEGINGWESNPVDITDNFKALVDFENLEVGPINFNTGGAPSFLMVRRDDVISGKTMLPAAPDTNHKVGVRFMMKLAKDVGGDKPIRELAQNSRAFLGAIEAVMKVYAAEVGANPGKLPVIVLDGRPQPVKSGSGTKSSTNYHPKFKVIGWANRGDLVYVPKTLASKIDGAAVKGTNGNGNGAAQSDPWDVAPSTGSTTAAPPKAQTVSADDFG